MTPAKKEKLKNWIAVGIIVAIVSLIAFLPSPSTPTNTSSQAETIDETELLGIQFENTTTSGIERETIQLEVERVTVAKPLEQIKFTENPDGQVILMRSHSKSDTLKEELTQPYTILIPTQRLGLIQSEYQKVFGKELPLVDE